MLEELKNPFEIKEAAIKPVSDSPPERILAAGRKLFFQLGFERVSTDMIAKEAKVSKASLYKYFPNMSAVLTAVVQAEGVRFEAGVPLECESLEDLKAALIQYGTGLLRFLNDPEIIQFTKLMHEEARAHPKVAAEFYHAAYGQTHRNLSAMIAYGKKKGYVQRDLTADDMAEQLMGMWESLKFIKTVLGLMKKPYANPRDWATKCVETLLVEAPGA